MTLDLALIRFPGETKAEGVLGVIRARQGIHAAWANEVALVEHHRNGRVSVRVTLASRSPADDSAVDVSQSGAVEGTFTGALVGAIFGLPGFGSGVTHRAIATAGPDTPAQIEQESLLDALRSSVPMGASALVLLAAADRVDALLSARGEAGGAVFRRTLTAKQVTALTTAATRATSGGPQRTA
ncbi:MAG: DUF1269 domain-containing protein [Solirubrobacteraceae bacterium]